MREKTMLYDPTQRFIKLHIFSPEKTIVETQSITKFCEFRY